jgi:hypothetical protein
LGGRLPTPARPRDAWQEVLEELGTPGTEASIEAQRLGIGPDDLPVDAVTVEERDHDTGLTIAITFAIAIAPTLQHILNGLWDDLVRPRIRRKYGVDVEESVE